MKKLMIAFVAIATAIVTNAASVNWSVDYTYKMGTQDAAEGWAMFFFDNAEVARADMIAAITSNSYSEFVATYGGVASDLTDADGYADGWSKKTTYGNPESIEGYFVLFNSDAADDATYAFISETMQASTGPTAGQNANMEFGDVIATQDIGNWTSIGAIPEPTSGLMMLLGMGVLALRRRRA